MERQPLLGSFGLGLSYGLPAGVLVNLMLAATSDDPDIGLLFWVGIVVAVAVALFVMGRDKTKHP